MNPKTDGQSRRNDASTQSAARLTHLPRFGEALITLRLSDNVVAAADGDSSLKT
jgi:hypothetical protein